MEMVQDAFYQTLLVDNDITNVPCAERGIMPKRLIKIILAYVNINFMYTLSLFCDLEDHRTKKVFCAPDGLFVEILSYSDNQLFDVANHSISQKRGPEM